MNNVRGWCWDVSAKGSPHLLVMVGPTPQWFKHKKVVAGGGNTLLNVLSAERSPHCVLVTGACEDLVFNVLSAKGAPHLNVGY